MSEIRFFKLSDLQTMFGVSRSTIWRWHAERGLRVMCVGRVKRIREADLSEFMEKHMKDAAPQAN